MPSNGSGRHQVVVEDRVHTIYPPARRIGRIDPVDVLQEE